MGNEEWSGYREDHRWQMGFARNQSGGKDGLSAAKSDWVSQSQSAHYSVVCGRVRLGQHQPGLHRRCFRSTKRSVGWEKQSGKGLEYAGDPRKTREQSGRPRKVREDTGEGQKVVEASGTRLEAVEEVVDAEEAREVNWGWWKRTGVPGKDAEVPGRSGTGDKDTWCSYK